MLGQMLACSDATVIAFVPRMKGLSVPSRMYNVMAAGAPIVAVADGGSELALTVAETGAGWVLAPGDAPGLIALVEGLLTAPGRADAIARGAAGRRAVEHDYTLASVLDKIRAVLGD